MNGKSLFRIDLYSGAVALFGCLWVMWRWRIGSIANLSFGVTHILVQYLAVLVHF